MQHRYYSAYGVDRIKRTLQICFLHLPTYDSFHMILDIEKHFLFEQKGKLTKDHIFFLFWMFYFGIEMA